MAVACQRRIRASRHAVRVCVEGIGQTAERGNCDLSQPPVGFALALRALGGDKISASLLGSLSGTVAPVLK
jgi:hypothetical protein